MELERHIEKWLRAFAKKRRAEAGDALKLHPATRRLLQGEAARHAPKPDTKADDSLSLWDLLRRRWAVLLGFAVIVFFSAALFLPGLHPAKQKSQKVLALNQAKERELKTAERLEAAAPSPVPPPGALAEADRKKTATNLELAFNRPVDALSARMETVNQPKPSTAPAGATGALTDSGGIGGGGFAGSSSVDQAGADKRERAPASAAAPAAPVTATVAAPALALTTRSSVATQTYAARSFVAKSVAELSSLTENSQRFVQAPAATAPPPPVLASFEVRQNGNAIAVVDRDGSVYNGTLEPVGQAAAQAGTKQLKDESAATQNYSFQVSGSNRTLNQNVVFVGNVTGMTNGMTNATANGTQNLSNQLSRVGGGRVQSASVNSLPAQTVFFNSRITGTATIDRTNQIEINAVPVAP